MANFDAESVVSSAEFASGAGRSDVPANIVSGTVQHASSVNRAPVPIEVVSSTVQHTRSVGRGVPLAETEVFLGRRYFKFRASCSNAPSGYVTWVNTTGNDEGRPTCNGVSGTAQLVETWVQ